MRLHMGTFARRSFYTEELLHTEAFTQRSVFTQKLLHRGALAHSGIYWEEPLHRGAFTLSGVCTQKLLHAEAFTHRSFYTQKLLHTEAFTYRSFYTGKSLHRGAFTQRRAYTHESFYTQTCLHTEAFTHRGVRHRSFYPQRTFATEDLCDVAKFQFFTSFCPSAWFRAKGLRLKFHTWNFTPVLDLRPSFRAKGSCPATKNSHFTTRLRVWHARSPQRVAPDRELRPLISNIFASGT